MYAAVLFLSMLPCDQLVQSYRVLYHKPGEKLSLEAQNKVLEYFYGHVKELQDDYKSRGLPSGRRFHDWLPAGTPSAASDRRRLLTRATHRA